MTTTSILWLGALLAIAIAPQVVTALYLLAFGVFGALTQALSPKSKWLPWSIPGPVRALALAIIAAVQTGFESAQNGQPLGTALLIALATTSAGWIALVIQVVGYYAALKAAAKAEPAEAPAAGPPKSGPSNPIPPTAALLVIGMVAWGTTACQATLEESRPKAPLVGISVAGVQMLTPGSPECLRLSEKQHLWNGLALGGAALGLSGLAGAIVEQAARDGKDKAVLYSALIAGGVFGAAAEMAREIGEGYRIDWQSLGCGAP